MYEYDRAEGRFFVTRSAGWEAGTAFDPATPPIAYLDVLLRDGETFVCPDVRIDPRARSLRCTPATVSCLCRRVDRAAGRAAGRHRRLPLPDAHVQRRRRPLPLGDFANDRRDRVLAGIQFAHGPRCSKAFTTRSSPSIAICASRTSTGGWPRSGAVAPSEMIGAPLAEFTGRFTDDGVAHRRFRDALIDRRSVRFETPYAGTLVRNALVSVRQRGRRLRARRHVAQERTAARARTQRWNWNGAWWNGRTSSSLQTRSSNRFRIRSRTICARRCVRSTASPKRCSRTTASRIDQRATRLSASASAAPRSAWPI